MVALPAAFETKGPQPPVQAKPNWMARRLQRDPRKQLWGLIMRRIGTVLVALAALSATGAHAAGNLLADGGFEAPNLGNGNYIYPVGALDAWTYNGAVLINAQSSSAWYGGSAPAGQQGLQFAGVQGSGSLSQSFTATATTLLLTWLNAGRPYNGGYDGDQTYQVMLDGVAVGTFSTTSGQAFTQQNLTLGALTSGSSHTLTYQGLEARDETAFIDNVSLTAAVPEPATWAMMIIGFAGIGLTLRGSRRAEAAAA
jgi:hypothetical protein